MGELIFFLLIGFGIYFLFFKKNNPVQPPKKENEDKDLIMCDKCKTFVSEDEIIQKNGKNICKECYDNSWRAF